MVQDLTCTPIIKIKLAPKGGTRMIVKIGSEELNIGVSKTVFDEAEVGVEMIIPGDQWYV